MGRARARRSRFAPSLVLTSSLALATCRGAVADAQASADPRPFTAPQRPAAVAASRHSAIVDAAARVAPAVVSVNIVKREVRSAGNPFDFFFVPRGSERLVQGIGSGFLISPDGVVITNQHVTAEAQQIVVTTRDGGDFPAKLLGEDPLTDIAVLKIEGTGFPTAPLGSSRDLMIGEWVVRSAIPMGTSWATLNPRSPRGW